MRLLPNGEDVKMRHCYGKSFNAVRYLCNPVFMIHSILLLSVINSSLIFSSDSKAFASKLIENDEVMFFRYYTHVGSNFESHTSVLTIAEGLTFFMVLAPSYCINRHVSIVSL